MFWCDLSAARSDTRLFVILFVRILTLAILCSFGNCSLLGVCCFLISIIKGIHWGVYSKCLILSTAVVDKLRCLCSLGKV